jgi:SAM-dependent methyltransferase
MINWHDRYARVLQREPALFDVDRSVLEVGCGPRGIALWLQRPVVGVKIDWSEPPPNPLIEPVSGDALKLACDADAFDFVVCVGMLEQLAERAHRLDRREPLLAPHGSAPFGEARGTERSQRGADARCQVTPSSSGGSV